MRDDAERWVLLVLRVLLGVMFIAHGSLKLEAALRDPSIPGFSRLVQTTGFTPVLFWAWVVTLVEFVGGVCLVVGLFTRVAAALIVIEMIVAGIKVNLPHGFFYTTAGIEVPVIFAVIGTVLALAGPGAYSLDGRIRSGAKLPPKSR